MPEKRILILDDDEAVAQTIQWIAQSFSYQAEFTTCAADFFASYDRSRPDAITLDLAMPGLDGIEMIRLLAERKCHARIIICSGMGTRILDAAQRSAAEHGLAIAGLLPKPISREALSILLGNDDHSPSASVEDSCVGCAAPADSVPTVSPSVFHPTPSDLEAALEHRDFVLAYQPKIHCKSHVITGFEALVRWQHPGHGLIMPDSFIPLAEQTGLIDPLTTQIVEQSFAWFSAAFPHSGLMLSVNISARCFGDLQISDKLYAICCRFQLSAERIIIEVTESSAMVDPILSLDLLTRLRVKGFHLSIDDFGTGFSSMVQLVRLPFSEMKIDKSFVIHASQSQESRTVIKSIVELGHSLGLTVTAEGVETPEVLDYLNTVGCDTAQGYLIARPLPPAAAQSWAAHRPSPPTP
jgi:EAL domain-containing protein (putative c-di-GMP-specific phosphodiesterase class I)/ActR/RegA family two-component response regulator